MVGYEHGTFANDANDYNIGKTFTFENIMNKKKENIMNTNEFPWPYVVDEEEKIVYIGHRPSLAWIAIPGPVKEHFGPEYRGVVASPQAFERLEKKFGSSK